MFKIFEADHKIILWQTELTYRGALGRTSIPAGWSVSSITGNDSESISIPGEVDIVGSDGTKSVVVTICLVRVEVLLE